MLLVAATYMMRGNLWSHRAGAWREADSLGGRGK